MGDNSKIEWCTTTWSPITGCTKISPGCKNCYAERMAKRLAGRYGYPKDEPFRPGTEHFERWMEPKRWKKRRMIFVCSMGDLFHRAVKKDWINNVYFIAQRCPQHTFLLLTKRPERAREYLDQIDSSRAPFIHHGDGRYLLTLDDDQAWPLPNVWLGVTAENQEQADKRIPALLQIPAAKRFVSIEPMLGPVYLKEEWIFSRIQTGMGYHKLPQELLRWVILGGETGPGWRNMDLQWARDVRDQCKAADVPFFMKKMAGGGQPPDDLMVREYPA